MVRSWKASAEHPQLFCVSAATPAQGFKAIAKFCKEENLDFVYDAKVYFADDDFYFELYY